MRGFILLLLAGSGCAALIYQVVWFQLLGLVIGASFVSLGVLLATFMGGMCAGSLLLWRIVSPHRHPLRVFAVLELGIGAIGLAVLGSMPLLGGLYATWAGSGGAGLELRAAVAAAAVLPPTILMGATLPAAARWMETSRAGVSRIGLLYAANLFGAVAGSLLAGFYLLRVHDVAVATFAAAGLNAAVAAASFALAARRREAGRDARGRTSTGDALAGDPAANAWPVHVAIGLSGLTALGAEVLWTRQLSLLLGATVYTFSLILAVFLLGLGLGGAAGARLWQRAPPRLALAGCQLMLCAAVAWAAYALARSLPYWPLDVTLPTAPSIALQLDLLRTAWVILPAALLWGASFPLALAAAPPRRDPARLVGGLYAANTFGAISGALAMSWVLIAWLGTRHAQQLLILLSACSAILLLTSSLRAGRRPARASPTAAYRAFGFGRWRRAALILCTALGAVVLAGVVPPLPPELVAYGRFMPARGAGAEVIYVGEGLTSSIAVSREQNGMLTYHGAGKAQASTYPQDMRLQRMLGHLTTLIAQRQRDFLVIGLGAGITAGAVSVDPAVERMVVAEIEPLARIAASEYFRAQNFGVLDDPKMELHIDDGRHYLATTGRTFDGITSDPLDPWVKGAAALYTREFWELVESRLNPGGVVTVFVQLYESTEKAVKSEIATFFQVFPDGAVFANTVQGRGYDIVLLGRAGGSPIDLDRLDARLERPEYERVARALREIGFHSATELLATFAGRAADLSPWIDDAVINRDRNLRLQYLAGQGLNRYQADVIFKRMTGHGIEFPRDLFSGSPARLDTLERMILARQAP